MKLWKTLGLLAVFAALLVYVMVYERGEAPEETADRAVQALLGFGQVDDVQELTVQASEHNFTVARQAVADAKASKAAPAWQITAPRRMDSDSVAIESYVKAVLGAKAERFYSKDALDDDDAVSDYGFGDPVARLTVKGAAGKTATLLIGQPTPDNASYYAQVQGREGLIILNQAMVQENLLNKTAGDFRNKALLAFQQTEVQTIKLAYPAQQIELRRDADKWTMTVDGKSTPADRNAIEGLLSSLSSAQIDSFVEDEPSDLTRYGLGQPRVTVTLGLGGGSSKGLLLGDTTSSMAEPDPMNPQAPPMPEEKVYAQRAGDKEVLLLPAMLYDALLKTPEDLRDKEVLAVQAPDVTKLVYWFRNAQVELAKQPAAKPEEQATWQLVAPQKMPADERKVKELLDALDQMLATGFVDQPGDLAQYGLAEPQGWVEVTQTGGALPRLLLGKAASDGSGIYVKRADQQTVYKVPGTILDRLPTEPARLRDLTVMKVDRAEVKTITLAVHGAEPLVLEAAGEQQWKLTKPVAKDADPGRVGMVLSALEDLHADEYVADKATNLAQYGLDKPAVTATIKLRNGREQIVQIAADPQGGLATYLKRGDTDVIYRDDESLTLTELQKKPEDFEPLDMSGFGGMGGMEGMGQPAY